MIRVTLFKNGRAWIDFTAEARWASAYALWAQTMEYGIEMEVVD